GECPVEIPARTDRAAADRRERLRAGRRRRSCAGPEALLLQRLVEQPQLIRLSAGEAHRGAGRARAAHEPAQHPGAPQLERRDPPRPDRQLLRRRKIDRGERGLERREALGHPLARQLELQVLTGAPNLDAHAWYWATGRGRVSAWRAGAPRGTRGPCRSRAR